MSNKPTDEMFPDDPMGYNDDVVEVTAGRSSNLAFDYPNNEKIVHSDFNNDFGDLFDDEDLA